ncbi:serine hydrolase domain-containing protein [Cyclobacterium jeungdonense]|uniref:Serine hydrolase domain-containing protein n=1 Tax=Cyclobacterium jeungdonense TaxID=708087 RepID=A0ABT8CA34_9BACT|nr:serine hydrolase domain-containing protein [Cyclobacterium jeungdonense]MDN3689207.1 serine hydrolase domain-containing protein [Cyclobacterium jeungdonense]
MTKILITLFTIVCLLVSMGCRQKKEEVPHKSFQHLTQKIDSLFKAQNQQDLFHGGVVITQKGETLYESYLGIADRSWNIPIEQDTKFDIASVNKSMIAALVLKAVEEGKLHLEDKLVDLLSGFSYEGNFHPEITLHHMLSHSSGLPDYDAVSEPLRLNHFLPFKRLRFTNESYVDFISKIELVNQPGKQFYYSNFAYHLLPILLEETYQKPFGELLNEKLTRPLGLEHTVSESKNEIVIPKLANAYNYQKETGQWHQNLFIDLSLGRRIFSTASDLNRWAQVMDNPGWLSATSLKLMQQNHQTEIDEQFSYGYGWVVIDAKNKSKMVDLGIQQPYIIHGGSTEGYKAMLININQGAYVISFLSNVGNRTHEIQLAQEIVNILIK